jgi:hypothetical protein
LPCLPHGTKYANVSVPRNERLHDPHRRLDHGPRAADERRVSWTR